MPSPMRLFALPASIILLITTSPVIISSEDLQWPHNLPPHMKYYPEDEVFVKRQIDVQKQLQRQPVAGMRKMSNDPGEKFFFDYWTFAPSNEDCGNASAISNRTSESSTQLRPDRFSDISSNLFEPAFPLHSDQGYSNPPILPRHLRSSPFGHSLFDKRAFQCPNGTLACTSIGEPNSCCGVGESCEVIEDTGLGSVGCCPVGQTCGGSLTTCPSGYTSCPNNPGGGCCIPGYACYDVGCAISSTATVFVTPTVTSNASSSSTSIATTTVVVPPIVSISTSVSSSHITSPNRSTPGTTVVSVSTTTTTLTSSKTSTIHNTLVCSSGFQSCPASVGGGCCKTDRACGSQTCAPLTSTQSVVAPVRPTSAATTTTTDASTISGVGCPTGFYACSAFYPGGCCQVGRDCGPTSCPASISTTLVNSAGITVVAPTGSGITANSLGISGTCATGWFSCASTDGGGCCPSGYGCGTSCTATASGGQGSTVGKVAPSSADHVHVNHAFYSAFVMTILVTAFSILY